MCNADQSRSCVQGYSAREHFLLVAVNAKYIHSNLAVYSLRAYAQARGVETELAEYTINHQQEDVLQDIYLRKPDVIGFSCYIWNMDFIQELAQELHKVMPWVPIWMGGPEVSWNPETRLEEMPFVTGIMVGEGEAVFTRLAAYYRAGGTGQMNATETGGDHMADIADGLADLAEDLADIPGICFRNSQGKIVRTAPGALLPMDELVFPYKDLSHYANRIIYYESSRGCPFSCSYCLSSVEKKLRFRSLPLVYKELEFFLKEKPAQVKFVDRTFNCRHEHAYGIWQYILEHDNGVTNFHFEIAADLLREEDFELFARMRPGLIQLEIGVQTTNPEAIQAIGRTMDLEKVAQCTKRVRDGRNIHQHLDLIAGLPREDLESFQKSFNDVYAMKPDQLQLGFLKVLHGTRMEQEASDYGLVYRTHPVYEVLYTKWLSFDDILQLKHVEETVEDYYNSGQFACTLSFVVPFFDTPFSFFSRFGNFLREQGYRNASLNRADRYMALRHFLQNRSGQTDCDMELLDELLSFDFCLREKLKHVPAFIPDQEPYRKQVSDFFAREIQQGSFLGEKAKAYSYRQLRARYQPLVFRHNVIAYTEEKCIFPCGKDTEVTQDHDRMQSGSRKAGPYLALFDYENRSAMSHNGRVIWIPLQELGGAYEE